MTGIRKYVWKSRESFDPFYFKFVLFVVVLCCIDGAHGLSNGGFAVYKNGTMGKETLGIVSSAEEDIYAFNLTKRLNSSQAVIIKVETNATRDFPLLVVVQQQKGVSSWTVPFTSEGKTLYKRTSHVLCPGDNHNSKDNQTGTEFLVSLSSYSLSAVNYSLYAEVFNHFMLKLDEEQVAEVSPSEPMIYAFEFPDGVDTVLVKAESYMNPCSVLSVQGTRCPIFDLARSVEFTGNFQTMRHKSGIVVQKDDFPSNEFYVVLVVLGTDERCKSGKRNKNPFRNNDVFRDSDSNNMATFSKEREKNVTVKVVKIPSEDEYWKAIVVPIVVFLGFYVISAVLIYIRTQYDKKHVLEVSIEGTTEGRRILPDSSATGYGTTEPEPQSLQSIPDSQVMNDEDVVDHADGGSDGGFDLLKDIEEDKEVYLLKKELFLSDLSKKKRKRLQKKYNLYQWSANLSMHFSLCVVAWVLQNIAV